MTSDPTRSAAVMPFWASLLVAAASGPILDAGFPDRDWWPLAFAGIALLLLSLIGRRAGSALLVGFVAGLCFYFTHVTWAAQFLGDVVPLIALAVTESLFVAAGSALIALAYAWLPQRYPGALGRLGLLPAVVAGLWIAREAVASVWPYGGFAWGRVALSQSESPIISLFSWLGVSGVGFSMVLIVALAIEGFRYWGVSAPARAAVPAAAITLALLVPAFPVGIDGSIRVAAVQGNGRAAFTDNRDYGDLLRAQWEATKAVDGEKVDVVLWPESGTDIDPTRNGSAARVFDSIGFAFDAPFVSGAITEDGDVIYNSSLLWVAGEGAVDKYDKRHPVPFGEYIPDRAFWRPFAPDLIDLVQREYTPGTTDTIFDLGKALVGVNICFDIVDDGLMRESIRDGAQLIFAQTNNADFGRSDESLQQLAVARVRALELGRSVVNISTVGTSAIILADGSTLDQLESHRPGAMVADVPTSSTLTPAALLGWQLEWLVSLFGLLALLLAGVSLRGHRG